MKNIRKAARFWKIFCIFELVCVYRRATAGGAVRQTILSVFTLARDTLSRKSKLYKRQ